MMSMTAITIRTWIQLPVRGNLGLMFLPKKPSSHRINRIMIIVHNMRFLLLNVRLLEAIWSVDRMTVDLTIQYDENSDSNGEDRQNQVQAT
jgi:hypothetical protein